MSILYMNYMVLKYMVMVLMRRGLTITGSTILSVHVSFLSWRHVSVAGSCVVMVFYGLEFHIMVFISCVARVTKQKLFRSRRT